MGAQPQPFEPDRQREPDADLQRQLGTGAKSDTYAGVGLDRGLAVGMRARLSTLGGYTDTATMVDTRIDLAQTVLTDVYNNGQIVR